MRCKTSIKLFLQKKYPYRKNVYRIFLIKCLSLNLMKLKCGGALTESELFKALTSMDNDKSPGNDVITKEFYIKF